MIQTSLNYDFTITDLCRMSFRYSREGGKHGVSPIMLTADGQITGHRHRNEASWKVVDGKVAFFTADGLPSTIFEQSDSADGKVVLRGEYLLQPEKKIVHLLEQVDFSWENRPRHHALTSRFLAAEIKRYGWKIGDHTYGRPTVLEKSMAKLNIGKFCSIAANVTVVLGNHRTDGVTTYPFATMKQFWPAMSSIDFNDHVTKGDVNIGSDVWIGCGVTIMSGVEIGHGAVIAANSVVTKDIQPYSIVGGNPAKLIKLRVSEAKVKSLLRMRWWEWSDEKLNARLPIMMRSIDEFLGSL
jgi:acetyltransferase-like isoleucine patch superfamily enzyme